MPTFLSVECLRSLHLSRPLALKRAIARSPIRRLSSSSRIDRASLSGSSSSSSSSSDNVLLPDTIFAPATPPGKSAICVIRISGPSAFRVHESMVRSDKGQARSALWPPAARRACLRWIHDPASGEPIDQGLVLFFPASSSLTAQDMLELHLHGSTAVMKAALAALGNIEGLRPAEPGEFTRLAFDGGKMDLTEVEGLRDLIESETEAQRRIAVRQAGGAMRAAYDSMRADIISAMSSAEALIDFGEDASISLSSFSSALDRIRLLRDRISASLTSSASAAEIVRAGIRLAIFGAPNAGKSSFVNWLAKREASIVTPHPGTTRDVLELSLDIRGYPVIVSDTAGLREAADEVEQIGVQRAKAVVQQSDIKLCIISIPELAGKLHSLGVRTLAELEARLASDPLCFDTVLDELTVSLLDEGTLFLLNKTDALASVSDLALVEAFLRCNSGAPGRATLPDRLRSVSISAQSGLEAFSSLLQATISARFADAVSGAGDLLCTQDRHRFHLEECLSCLDAALDMCKEDEEGGLEERMVDIAEELRYASMALGKVTGQIGVEDMLDNLFASFCIGK